MARRRERCESLAPRCRGLSGKPGGAAGSVVETKHARFFTMLAFIRITPVWRNLLSLAAALLAVGASAAQSDLSGLYADEGTTISTEPTLFQGDVSLHALLRLEFDERLVKMRRQETDEVRLNQSQGVLEVQALGEDGEVAWRSRFNATEATSEQGGRVLVLRMQPAQGEESEYLLLFERSTGGLLQVTVRRVESTLLGPMVRATGVYVFSHLR